MHQCFSLSQSGLLPKVVFAGGSKPPGGSLHAPLFCSHEKGHPSFPCQALLLLEQLLSPGSLKSQGAEKLFLTNIYCIFSPSWQYLLRDWELRWDDLQKRLYPFQTLKSNPFLSIPEKVKYHDSFLCIKKRNSAQQKWVWNQAEGRSSRLLGLICFSCG